MDLGRDFQFFKHAPLPRVAQGQKLGGGAWKDEENAIPDVFVYA